MPTYIAILRGINVSGQKKIKMADLRALLGDSGLQNVQTYIQSGNVMFNTGQRSPGELSRQIEQQISKEYGFEVTTLVLTTGEWKRVMTHNPFARDSSYELKKMYVTFLSKSPEPTDLENLAKVDHSPEVFVPEGKTIYLYFPNGYGRAKMTNNFFEKKLNLKATTRNWKTVHKLWMMAHEQ